MSEIRLEVERGIVRSRSRGDRKWGGVGVVNFLWDWADWSPSLRTHGVINQTVRCVCVHASECECVCVCDCSIFAKLWVCVVVTRVDLEFGDQVSRVNRRQSVRAGITHSHPSRNKSYSRRSRRRRTRPDTPPCVQQTRQWERLIITNEHENCCVRSTGGGGVQNTVTWLAEINQFGAERWSMRAHAVQNRGTHK